MIPINQQQPAKFDKTDTSHVVNQQQGKMLKALKKTNLEAGVEGGIKHYLNHHTLNNRYPDYVGYFENAHRDLRDKVQKTYR